MLVLALIMGIIGVAVAAWWWRHPTVFDEPEARSTVGVGERRPAAEGPIHLAMVRPSDRGPGSAELSSAEPHVLMTIRPRQVGEVRVKGIDLTYTHGAQSGTQQVGDHVWFRYVSPRADRG